MKAIVYHKYGPPNVLRLEEVQKPTPRDDEVLVKVHAASVNSWDWDLLRGTPFLARVTGGGLLNPNPPKDTDGRREESGRGVRELQGK